MPVREKLSVCLIFIASGDSYQHHAFYDFESRLALSHGAALGKIQNYIYILLFPT